MILTITANRKIFTLKKESINIYESCTLLRTKKVLRTALCFLCNSSAYFVTSFISSATLWAICKCKSASLSAAPLRAAQTGANVPCAPVLLPACLATLLRSL